MKALIVSDTHGKDENIKKVAALYPDVDMLFHLGDLQGSEDYIEALMDCPVMMVSGNNDFYSDLELEKTVVVGSHRVFMTHGHYYYISSGVGRLHAAAVEQQCDIAMCGHTHRPMIRQEGGVWLINPGSLSYPRQEDGKYTYIIMEIDDSDQVSFTLHNL